MCPRRRRRHSNEDFQHKWQDRRSSSPPAPLPSDEHDDWREREDIRTSRRRPRSLDRAEDTSISEWDGTRPSKGIRGEPEEDMYSRRGSRRPPSDESVDDWAIVHAPPRPKKPIMDEQDDPREPRRPRRSRERGPRLAPGDGPSDYETDRSGHVGRRYGGVKDRRKRLWTEITKDLVLREAIERAGYEYEETEFFYYIFDYLQYVRLPPPMMILI